MKSYKFPNLFIPGAGKSGTSSLHAYLDQHSEISMSVVKEPHYWTAENFESYTQMDHDKYESLFEFDDRVKVWGESSTGYMCFPNFINRIKAELDVQPKFIFILRNPVDRCYSHYWWLKGMGSEKAEFRLAVLNDFDLEPSPKTKLPESNYKSYFQFGLYGKWLQAFYANFDRDQIKIVCSEKLKSEPLKVVNDCIEFLGLSPLDQLEQQSANPTQRLRWPALYRYSKLIAYNKIKMPQWIKDATPGFVKRMIRKNLMKSVHKLTATKRDYPPMLEDDRLWLTQLYAEDVSILRRLTGQSFDLWTDFKTSD